MDSSYASNLLRELNEHEGVELEEVLLRIKCVFEKFVGQSDCELFPEIDDINFTTHEINKLKGELIRFIEHQSENSEYLGSGVWALSANLIPSDRSILIVQLKRCVEINNSNVYQILCALALLGDRVAGEAQSIFENKFNRSIAIKCLENNIN